ncbi:uncharacterized protein LOC110270856 [Arachis ipaensis]|uniref:uncharacterized protein LOC110270856 n=1 Tax=Arachis ipaensis TaxID=130454 RepID=UPI000A2B3BA9|nr:uncharacterized protein LOC110270856 [Arachis ipaensis]
MHYEFDEWSLQEIVSELQKLGYKGNARIRYCEPGCQLSSGLRELMSNGDAMRMDRLLVLQTVKHCSVYVVDGCREDPGLAAAANGKDPNAADTVPTAAAAAVDTDPAADNRSGVNICRSERIRQTGAGRGRIRGRGRGRAAFSQPLPTTPTSSQQLPTTPTVAASTQAPPILATSASQAPTTSTGAVAPTTATSQQALPLEGPVSQPLLAVASAKSHQAPRASSQPLPKTKVFGVRRSGRLKLGVMKQKGAPNLHIDISDD